MLSRLALDYLEIDTVLGCADPGRVRYNFPASSGGSGGGDGGASAAGRRNGGAWGRRRCLYFYLMDGQSTFSLSIIDLNLSTSLHSTALCAPQTVGEVCISMEFLPAALPV
jgi:hypothetical protein